MYRQLDVFVHGTSFELDDSDSELRRAREQAFDLPLVVRNTDSRTTLDRRNSPKRFLSDLRQILNNKIDFKYLIKGF